MYLYFWEDFRGIPTEVLERANLDGCSKFEMVFKIKLPMIFNHMQVALMLGTDFSGERVWINPDDYLRRTRTTDVYIDILYLQNFV